jgi:hypothetical protein
MFSKNNRAILTACSLKKKAQKYTEDNHMFDKGSNEIIQLPHSPLGISYGAPLQNCVSQAETNLEQ